MIDNKASEFHRALSPWRKIRNFFWRASTFRLPKGPHITRYTMYLKLQELGPNLPIRRGRVLAISKSQNLIGLCGIDATEVVTANYPEVSIMKLPYEDNSFDFVLSDQILEHVEGNPFEAIAECYRVLRPGGIAIHTTCFVNPVHGFPDDFWRFTPHALSLLHKKWSNIIEVDGWGNFKTWKLAEDGLRFQPIPHAKWHPLNKAAVENDERWPIVTWIAAQK